MASELNVANISGVVLWANIVMLQYASGIEIGNEGCRGSERLVGSIFDGVVEDWIAEIFRRVEIFIYFVYFSIESTGLLVSVADCIKAFPQ